MTRQISTEKKIVLGAVLAAVLLIVLTSVFAPAHDEDDPQPSTFNSGPQGAKAAYLLLGKLGYRTERFEKPLSLLHELDAPHTTFVLSNPSGASSPEEQKELGGFLERGGRVLADGWYGGDILPGLYWKNGADDRVSPKCNTRPEGTSALAEAGPLRLDTELLARPDLAQTAVAQSCPDGAAVILYTVGKGTAIWWASPQPLTNRGLHEANNLKLLLASIGPPDRTVVFDETARDFRPADPWSKTKGLPIRAMQVQLLLVALLLVLAYGRRHGPVRTLSVTPRTSPLEFAQSMGGLYHRAGASEAAAQEARHRLLAMLERQCGLSRELLAAGPERVAAELRARFGFDDPAFASSMEEAAASTGRITPARALHLVQELHRLREALQGTIGRTPQPSHHNPNVSRSQEKPRV